MREETTDYMEIEKKPTSEVGATVPVGQAPAPMMAVIGSEQLKQFTKVLQEYKAGKARTEQRILSSENWWKLRNTTEEQKETNIGGDGGFVSRSGWLHNVITSKHADMEEASPEPNILPREEGDEEEARMLSAIVPCVLLQNSFDRIWSEICWQKLKTGTGAYKVIWDSSKLNGLGDIGVERVNLLNIYWEPGVTDIQRSRYIFHTELYDKDMLMERYPELKDKLKGQTFISTKFLYDDHVQTENKHTVIEVYYHKYIGGKRTVQYCKYVEDHVLFASENEPEWAERGYYDHGRFPYVFDPLFPVEGSPCGYGFVDLCRNPQMEIDLFKTSFVKNAMAGAQNRYFKKPNGGVNVEQFLDLNNPLVDVEGDLSEIALRPIEHNTLDGIYFNVCNATIQELRETSGNTETSTGNISSGVTAASAIAALQEASGKGSRDMIAGSYRAYCEIVELCIELIRQFYDMPRQFRIVGEYGAQRYISYTNQRLQAQHQGNDFGQDMGYRLPVFDVKVSAQKKNVYTKVTQNELALQFFDKGFFNPQMTDQALMCLDLMEFDGKDALMQKISQNGTMYQKLLQYMQMALSFAQKVDPAAAEAIGQDILMMSGGGLPTGGGSSKMFQSDNIAGIGKEEPGIVRNARARSNEASQPSGGRVTKGAGS